jgi:translation elongation factor EF-Tu-like GTPase
MVSQITITFNDEDDKTKVNLSVEGITLGHLTHGATAIMDAILDNCPNKEVFSEIMANIIWNMIDRPEKQPEIG